MLYQSGDNNSLIAPEKNLKVFDCTMEMNLLLYQLDIVKNERSRQNY